MSYASISGLGYNPFSYYSSWYGGSSQSTASGDQSSGSQADGSSFQTYVQTRLAMQSTRIEDGLLAGKLTQDQANQLQQAENSLQSNLQGLDSSGSTSFQDQSQFLEQLNQASANIFLALHPELASTQSQDASSATDSSGASTGLASLAQQLEANSSLTDDDKQRLSDLLERLSQGMRAQDASTEGTSDLEAKDTGSQDDSGASSGASTDLATLAQQLAGDSGLSDDDKQSLTDILGQASGALLFAHQLESLRESQGQDLVGLAQQLDSSSALSDDDKQQLMDLLNRISGNMLGSGSQATGASQEATDTGGQGASDSQTSGDSGTSEASATTLTSLAQQLENNSSLSDLDKLRLEDILARVGGRMQFGNLMAQAQAGTTGASTQTSAAGGAGGAGGASGAGGGSSSTSAQLAALEGEQAELQQELAAAMADPTGNSDQVASLEGMLGQVTAQINQLESSGQSA